MLDEPTLKRKVLLRLLGSPGTVAPLMLGLTAMTASWALNWQPALGLFAGLAGTLLAAGSFMTRLLLRGDKVAERVLRDTAQSRQTRRQRALDELDRRLATADKDPRPETALRDLRALVNAFEDYSRRDLSFTTGIAIEVQARTGLLFDQCVDSLKQTDQLWQIARNLRSPAARQPILKQREQLIADVQASARQLSDTLVALQRLGAGEGSSPQLARLRDELDQSLAAARAAEHRVQNLVRETSTRTKPPPIPTQPQT
ncbi:MAG: hypothetical protein JXQ71_02060 [Verrucomicrobia bacterium]|nr:hypothetical protein [Verrucomicrobiota bacterium]